MHNPQKQAIIQVKNAKKREGFLSKFRDFLAFWHSYPAVTFNELLNASADVDCPSDVVGQGGEGKLKHMGTVRNC